MDAMCLQVKPAAEWSNRRLSGGCVCCLHGCAKNCQLRRGDARVLVSSVCLSTCWLVCVSAGLLGQLLLDSHYGTDAGGCTVGCGGRVFGGWAFGGLGRECTSGGECVLQLHASAETDKDVEGATLVVGMGGWAQARMGARRGWAHGAGGRMARMGSRRMGARWTGARRGIWGECGWAHSGRVRNGRAKLVYLAEWRVASVSPACVCTSAGITTGCTGLTLTNNSWTRGRGTLVAEAICLRRDEGNTCTDLRTADEWVADGRMADGRVADGRVADGRVADGRVADGRGGGRAGWRTGGVADGRGGGRAGWRTGGVADGWGGGHVASAPARATAGCWAVRDHWAVGSGCRWDGRESGDRWQNG
ncbi:unnamed protein product [Closterium sp. Naga37s-1]|nr:unnamed protein product [Closterium sp. Naga37s-1]